MNNKVIVVAVALITLMLAACRNENPYPFQSDYLPVKLVGSNKWSILNVTTGEVVAQNLYSQAPSPVIDGMYYVPNQQGTYDFYDISAPTRVAHGGYGSVTTYSNDGVTVVSRLGTPLCVIDRQGDVIKELPKDVSQCSMFSRGRAAFQNDQGLWGYINTSGEIVIPAQYSGANLFVNSDQAIVVDDQQQGDTSAVFTIINRNGDVLFNGNYKQYQPIQPYFVSGVLPVAKGDTMVCLNADGQEVPNPNDNHDAVDKAGYDDYARTPSGNFTVIKKGKMGLVDKNNRSLIGFENDKLIDINGERYIAMNDSVCHIVDKAGNPIGTAQFTQVRGTNETLYAQRGFIDTDLAVGAMMMLFDEDGACGVTTSSSLMDVNRLLGSDAQPYVGANTLVAPEAPFMIQYVFDRDIASIGTDSSVATFNFNAQVKCVVISLNVRHCPTTTEQEIVDKLQGVLGKKGFVLARDGIFCSDKATAITMGYNNGNVILLYFMHFNESTPQPKIKRKS